MLKNAELPAIFVTEFKRAQETASPVGKETNISPTIVRASDTQALMQNCANVQGNTLVVGHGNTIPDIAKALGITTPINIAEDDYSELFLVILNDKPQLVRLHYSFY